MNVRKLLARLNAGTLRYDAARGGIPEMTAATISGALGFVPQGLGRELLCFIWWPQGAVLTRDELHHALICAQFEEWNRRADVLRAAQLADHLARTDDIGSMRKAEKELRAAREQMWPRVGPQSLYGAIREAVLAEMASPNLCETCRGHGNIMLGPVLVACHTCKGMGRAGESLRKRAMALGIPETTYRETWRGPYEYLHDFCVTAENDAAVKLETRLSREDALAESAHFQ